MSLRERQEGWAVPIDRVDAFTSGAAMAVEVGQIERELQALWRQAAERAQHAGSGLAVLRACLWNFIVHQVGEEGLPALKATLDEVSQAVPARIILLLERHGHDPGSVFGADEPLRAYVGANLRPGPGGRREVVAEEITLEVARMEAARLPSLVRSLLIGDVPTAIYAGGGVPDEERLGPLLAEADRIVLDSGRLGAVELPALAQTLHALGERAEVADLGWLRTASFRRLVASLFEEQPAALGAIEEVAVEYAPGAEAAALLLAGWLAARLGWRRQEGDFAAGAVRLEAAGRPLELRFLPLGEQPAPSTALPSRGPEGSAGGGTGPASATPTGPGLACQRQPVGGLAGLHLRAGDAWFRARSTGAAVGDRARCVELCGPHLVRAQLVQERRDSELLVRALGAFGRDPLLLEAVRGALRLLAASASTKCNMTYP